MSRVGIIKPIRDPKKINKQNQLRPSTRKIDQEGNICKVTSKGNNKKRGLLSMIPASAEFIGQERAYTSPIWHTP
jgi:hypothetical protein